MEIGVVGRLGQIVPKLVERGTIHEAANATTLRQRMVVNHALETRLNRDIVMKQIVLRVSCITNYFM